MNDLIQAYTPADALLECSQVEKAEHECLHIQSSPHQGRVQSLGSEPRIAHRIARAAYGLDPYAWQRRRQK